MAFPKRWRLRSLQNKLLYVMQTHFWSEFFGLVEIVFFRFHGASVL